MMNETNIDVTDNFLVHDKFVALRDIVESPTFSWYWNPTVVYSDIREENSPGFFSHSIYGSCAILSEFYDSHFHPIFNNVLEIALI